MWGWLSRERLGVQFRFVIMHRHSNRGAGKAVRYIRIRTSRGRSELEIQIWEQSTYYI